MHPETIWATRSSCQTSSSGPMFGSEQVWEALARHQNYLLPEEIPDITCAQKVPLPRIGQRRDRQSEQGKEPRASPQERGRIQTSAPGLTLL